jgi:hypothetical protein
MISGPTALLASKVEIISKTSKGGRSLFLSFRSETEQKCLFNIPAFFRNNRKIN